MPRVPSAILGLAAASAACGPTRLALPVPLAVTQGATAVPAQGVGGGLEFADAFGGQELARTEVLAAALTGGLRDRVSVSANYFSETRYDRVEGTILRAKVRAGSLTGPASNVGVVLSYTWTSREDGPAQNERVGTLDLAVPAEWLLATDRLAITDLSMYVGPRVLFERYTDLLDRAGDMNATLWGGVYGLHGRFRNIHIFAEASLVHSPGRTVRGTRFNGDWTVIPAFGLSLYYGRSHSWGRARVR